MDLKGSVCARKRALVFVWTRHVRVTASGLLMAALLIEVQATGCRHPPPTPVIQTGAKPAVVEPGRVTLTPQAEERLGILEGLSSAERRRLPERRLFAGVVMAAPGRAVVVTAPLSGTVAAVENGRLPSAGVRVRVGQPLLAMAPLLGLGERAQAATLLTDTESQHARAQAQAQAATLALERAERLIRDGLAGTKLLEEARAQHAIALAAAKAAERQRVLLSGHGAQPGLLAATRVVSPIEGTVRDLRVAPQQHVAAGTPLLELVSREELWLRVPVSSSEITRLDPERAAQIGALGEAPPASLLDAPPARPAPETALPSAGTVDLYFALPATAGFRLGQRIAAWLARRGEDECLIVPAAALLYGTEGEAWVYERTAPQSFSRRRVEVLRVEGAQALLRVGTAGLLPSARIVTAGAHELYGAELGVGK